MNIYRGPKTKDRYDNAHDLVWSSEVSPEQWKSDSYVVVGNISKDASERQSIAHVVINEEDVCRLHEGMLKKLLKQSEELRCANSHIEALHDLVDRMFVELSYYPAEEVKDLQALMRETREALQEHLVEVAEVRARAFQANSVLPPA